jgi:hypothetical protein
LVQKTVAFQLRENFLLGHKFSAQHLWVP